METHNAGKFLPVIISSSSSLMMNSTVPVSGFKPGTIRTVEEVFEVYGRYPWIVEETWTGINYFEHKPPYKGKGLHNSLREVVKLIQQYDPEIFEKATKELFPDSLPSNDLIDAIITEIKAHPDKWHHSFRWALRDRYFGKLYAGEALEKGYQELSRVTTPAEWNRFRDGLIFLGIIDRSFPLVTPSSDIKILKSHMFYLALFAHPEAFGLCRPKSSVSSLHTFLRSAKEEPTIHSFKRTRLLQTLPDKLMHYVNPPLSAPAEIGLKFEGPWKASDLLKEGFFERIRIPDHKPCVLEIELFPDGTEEDYKKIIQILLSRRIKLAKVRFVVQTSREENGREFKSYLSLHEYPILRIPKYPNKGLIGPSRVLENW